MTIRRRVPAGMLLPWWALCARAVLFPLDSFYWWMGRDTGYDIMTDTWRIGGCRFSGEMLCQLARSCGELYRIERIGDLTTLERVHDPGVE